jgi:hypothetical protein
MLKNPVPVKLLTAGRLFLLLTLAAVPMALAFAARHSPGAAKDQNRENRQLETWRIALNLQASDRLPSAVQWAIWDTDPVPAFKARLKKLEIYREQLRGAENEAARQEKRKAWLALQWNSGFKEIPGDRLYLLTSDNPKGGITSNDRDGKKWIVTKIAMATGKPVCWSIPVEVKYGEEIKVTLTDKNVFDLGAVAESAMREAATSIGDNKKIADVLRTTWRIQLLLRVPGSAPFDAAYAIFDEDPVPGFKAAVKKWQASRKDSEALKGDERQEAMASIWDAAIFRKIRGDRLHRLPSSRLATMASNEPDGKKWIVTRIVEIKGKPVCWYLPVEVKTGESIKVTFTQDNAFDLGAAFDSALRGANSTK